MATYDHKRIEKKWQEKWLRENAFQADDASTKEKKYVLDMYPYPSGSGLHVGHVEGYTATDIYSRYLRMKGFEVLHPMGWDAFGLPAENYAIKTNVPPAKTTEEAIQTFTSQINSLGLSYDWSREIGTHRPDYYKWTQWLFLLLYKNGLAYKQKAKVNWCPKDQTVLANEQVVDGNCERCGTGVIQKDLEQWFFRITKFAEELLADLEHVNWPESTKAAQRNWIGKSEGAEIDFVIAGTDEKIRVFTTRPDTLYGATYLVLAPEHPRIDVLSAHITNLDAVAAYRAQTATKTELERTALAKEKTGVQLEGIAAINPATKEEIPVFIADYVLSQYGTGAIMAVPAHDERDADFAKAFNLPVKRVVDEKKYFIFDFDGVLGDTFEAALAAHVAMGHSPDLEAAREAVLKYAHNKPRHTRDANPSPEVLAEERAWTARFGTAMLQSDWKLFDEFIREVEKIPNTQIAIVSSGSELYVKPASEKTRLNPTHVMAFETSHSKEEKIETICRDWGIDPKQAYYFTDSKADVYELKGMFPEGKLIGCAWGFVGKEALEEVLPRSSVLENYADIHTLFMGLHTGDGLLINSGDFTGASSAAAKRTITESVGGVMKTTYRLRDWLISRQRYWGAPIPMVYDPEGNLHPVPEEHLPWALPTDVEFKPTGESPMAKSKELRERVEKLFGPGWTPDVDTMDTFVCSSWYFFRFADPHNAEVFADKEKMKRWLPVDLYVGGAEHTVLHLLYARFFTKALQSLGFIDFVEPFTMLRHPGTILAEDGRKMSKSLGNVVNPTDVVAEYGADSLRLYEMFMGPLDVAKPWNTRNILGVRRFLEKIIALASRVADAEADEPTESLMHQSIESVTADIEALKFNTAISQLMIFANKLGEYKEVPRHAFETLLVLLSPLAPHLTHELWEQTGHADDIRLSSWPVADQTKLSKASVTVGVQVNGKVRGSVTLSAEATQEEALAAARAHEGVSKWLALGREVKAVYVPGRIISFVVESAA